MNCSTVHVSAGDPDVCGPVPLTLGATCEYIGPPCMTNAKCENGTCVVPEAAGRVCNSPHDCTTGLTCIDRVCAPQITEGSPCAKSTPQAPQSPGCAPGLGCDPQSQLCTTTRFAVAGEACDDQVTRCEVGSCRNGGTGGKGTCPQVLADGVACSLTASAICDSFAECIGGTCILTAAPALR